MPNDNRPANELKSETKIEDTDDFIFFTRNVLNATKESLLPLELQISIKRDQEAALKESLCQENTLNLEDQDDQTSKPHRKKSKSQTRLNTLLEDSRPVMVAPLVAAINEAHANIAPKQKKEHKKKHQKV